MSVHKCTQGASLMMECPLCEVLAQRAGGPLCVYRILSDVYNRHYILVVILKVLACHTPDECIVVCA